MGIYSITEEYAAWPVTLPYGPSLILEALTKDVIDDNYGDVVAVEVGEAFNDFLGKTFGLEDFEYPGEDHEIECSSVIIV